MSMRSLILFAILALVVVGVNATAYRVQETEKAILLSFGNLVDADIQARFALQNANCRRSEEI